MARITVSGFVGGLPNAGLPGPTNWPGWLSCSRGRQDRPRDGRVFPGARRGALLLLARSSRGDEDASFGDGHSDLEERFPGRYVYLKQVVRVQGLFESEIGRRLGELDCRHMGVEIRVPAAGQGKLGDFVCQGASEDECRRQLAEACRKRSSTLIGAHNVSGYGDDVLGEGGGARLLSRAAGGWPWPNPAREVCSPPG